MLNNYFNHVGFIYLNLYTILSIYQLSMVMYLSG
jgi:hypothetical protein